MHHLGLAAPAVPTFIAWQCAYGGDGAFVSAPEIVQAACLRSRPLLVLGEAGAPKRAIVQGKGGVAPEASAFGAVGAPSIGDYVVFACGCPAARAQSGCVRTSNKTLEGTVRLFYSRAAGAGRQYAPASLVRPLSVRPVSSVRSVGGLRLRAAPQRNR
jgi:hypothetical protein